jgi:PAS domain S-box-containing protein
MQPKRSRQAVLILSVIAAFVAVGALAFDARGLVVAALCSLSLLLIGGALLFRDLKAEATTRQHHELSAATLKSVMDATPVGLIAGRAGVAVYVNPAFVRMLGFSGPEQLVGRVLLDFVQPEEVASMHRRQTEWIEGQVPPPRRLRLRGQNGDVLVDSLPVPGDVLVDGAASQLAMVQRVADKDARELRVARQAAFALAGAELSRLLAEARFNPTQMLETVVRLTAAADDEVGLVRLWSRDQQEMTAGVAFYARNQKLLTLAQQFSSPSRTGGLNALVLKAGQAVTLTREAVLRNATPEALVVLGDSVPPQMALVPLRGQGRMLGLLAVARYEDRPFDSDDLHFLQDMSDRAGQALLNAQLFDDVSKALDERARAAEALRETEAQLRHSQKLEALGQLAGGVAHDFNNLLSVILSLSDLLLTARTRDDPEHADLSDIKSAGERAADLTRQLLAFSRKQVMQPRTLDLNEVVGGLESILRRLIGEDVSMTLALDAALPAVRADPTLLTQVVMNLVVNARDAMPRGGRLVVRTESRTAHVEHGPSEVPPGEYVCLVVVDEGAGIAPSVREHLFEPFFTTKPRGKGTGLGLSTSYGIARQSGGTMTVESIEGQGATFVVWLPVELEPSPSMKSVALPVRHESQGVILLVEDEPLVRDVAQRVLERAGYTLKVAGSAEEALLHAPGLGDFDLLVTDVVMPGRSGRELADALLEQRPQLRVLFMSGYTEDMVVKRGVLEGQMALLQKPFTPDSLLAAVRHALAQE